MREQAVVARCKAASGLLLGASALLPLCSLPAADGTRQRLWPIGLAGRDVETAAMLMLAFFWPILAAVTARASRGTGRGATVALAVEPTLAVVSIMVLWVTCGTAIGLVRPLGPWLLMPVRASLDVGAYVALAANIGYAVSWAVSFGRGWRAANTRRQTVT